MDGPLELGGIWLARVYAVYGVALLLIPGFLFAYVPVLAAAVWTVIWHARGQQPWPRVPAGVRRWARLALEIMVGLINPLLYLAVLVPSIPSLQFGSPWWLAPLMTTAWVLLTLFWTEDVRRRGRPRLARGACGRADASGRRAHMRAGLRGEGCVVARPHELGHNAGVLVCTPVREAVSAVPDSCSSAVGLIRSTAAPRPAAGPRSSLFLLPDRASRLAVAGMVCLAIVTLAFAMHRRSDSAARKLVSDHRGLFRPPPHATTSIHASSARSFT